MIEIRPDDGPETVAGRRISSTPQDGWPPKKWTSVSMASRHLKDVVMQRKTHAAEEIPAKSGRIDVPAAQGSKGVETSLSMALPEAACRDEFLDGEMSDALDQSNVVIGQWWRHDSPIRAHSSPGYRSPVPEAVVTPLRSH